MKAILPACLLVLLQLACAAPIPTSSCQDLSACRDRSSAAHSRPLSKVLANPHFPSHHLPSDPVALSHSAPSKIIRPTTIAQAVSEALAAPQPLSTQYLEWLSQTRQNLPSKPTSALAALRHEDRLRYWEDIRAGAAEWDAGAKNHLAELAYPSFSDVGPKGREQGDMLVVAIVVLFFIAIVAIEAADQLRSLSTRIFGHSRPGGEIFLEEDETVTFIVKRPFCLQPAPRGPRRYRKGSLEKVMEEVQVVEVSEYDGDASDSV